MPTKLEETNMLQRAQGLSAKIQEFRRHLHANPELSFEERETSRYVTTILSQHGYRVRPGIGGTGVLAEIGEGRTVAIRADMDALPIQEAGNHEYKSANPGVMHACGHDVHTACALGAALLLAEKPPVSGCVRFLFQPAEETVNEEGKSGASLLIEQGALENVEAIFALHVDPGCPVGHIGVREGAILAACDTFDISIKGKTSHGGYPHFGVDAVVLASHVVQAIQTIVSRRKSALEPAVLTVGGIRSDSYRPNIVAGEVTITGTVRYFNPQVAIMIFEQLKAACKIVEAMGGSYELRHSNDNPVLFNDAQMTNLVRFVGKELLGQDNVVDPGLAMGAEDFSFYSGHLPGCFFRLGTLIEGSERSIHTPTFDIDEAALPVGTALLAQIATRFLGG